MTLLDVWTSGLKESFNAISNGLLKFAPNLIVALVILLVGCFLANWIGKLVAQLVNALKIDDVLRSAKVEEVLKRGNINLHTGRFIGGIVKWYIVVIVLVAFFNVVGLTQVNDYLNGVVLVYLPKVLVAAVVILTAAVIANTMSRIVTGSAKAGGFVSANFLGSLTRWSILIFAFMVALVQLGVATVFIQTLFTGVVVALALAFGLSFGLGGQSAASDFIQKLRQEISDHSHGHN